MHIHIAIAFDANYLQQSCALVSSIVLNHQHDPVCIHAIATGIKAEKLAQMKVYVRQSGNGHDIKFYSVSDPRVKELITFNQWTKAVYYRLYFPMLVNEEVKRLIYLDADTLALKNLKDLNDISLDGFPVAAVSDNYVGTQPLIGVTGPQEYFNSGVLIIDVAAWRDQHISERSIDYLMKYPERIKFVDQCALNAILHRNWKQVNQRYNLLYSYVPKNVSRKYLEEEIKDVSILHFTLQRPWNMLCKNRLRFLYFHYVNESPLNLGKKKYTDFEWKKIPTWMRIRLYEFYLDHTLLRRLWRILK